MIAVNRKATFEYFIEDRYEAGLELQGWEVKSLRAGKCNISRLDKSSFLVRVGSLTTKAQLVFKGLMIEPNIITSPSFTVT